MPSAAPQPCSIHPNPDPHPITLSLTLCPALRRSPITLFLTTHDHAPARSMARVPLAWSITLDIAAFITPIFWACQNKSGVGLDAIPFYTGPGWRLIIRNKNSPCCPNPNPHYNPNPNSDRPALEKRRALRAVPNPNPNPNPRLL